MRHLFLTFLFCCVLGFANAQNTQDSIQKLDEVILSDVKLKHYSNGYKVEVLNDSVIQKNGNSLTDLLRYNTNIYFRENGYGMVSSPSFRGTNASQTAVVWNGININSQLTGQTDFNTISNTSFSDVTVRSGGGSVQYGSGAIGGTIHLNNNLNFSQHFNNTVALFYGSYDTRKVNYLSSYGNEKLSINVGLNYLDSKNDYKYLEAGTENENGAYANGSFNMDVGYILSSKNVLKLYHQTFIGERELSGTLSTPSLAKYEDNNFRTMLEWAHRGERFFSKLKLAHLQEHFRYYDNKNISNYSFGKVDTYIINYTAELRLLKDVKLKPIVSYTYYKGDGSSFSDPSRKEFSATALLQYRPNNKWNYNLSLRQDVTSEFKNPLLLSFDVVYNASEHYVIKFNGSKNYRIPTFNDLYWQPGGNLELQPETSHQIELGQELKSKRGSLALNAFYIKTADLIQWQPGNTGLWEPQNVAKTQNYGLEVALNLQKKIKAHNLSLQSNYYYTVAENTETDKQLIYVPYHKANINLAYAYKKLSLFFQHLYTGEVFTTQENLSGPFYSVDPYHVNNFGVSYKIIKTKSQQIDLNLRVLNLFNTAYENVAFRPMPDRNFNIQVQYKF